MRRDDPIWRNTPTLRSCRRPVADGGGDGGGGRGHEYSYKCAYGYSQRGGGGGDPRRAAPDVVGGAETADRGGGDAARGAGHRGGPALGYRHGADLHLAPADAERRTRRDASTCVRGSDGGAASNG